MAGSRRGLLAGASGLVGRALLARLEKQAASIEIVARRALDGWAGRPLLHVHVARDFASLPALPPVDDAYVALGTTIKAAGSQAAFRAVDFDAVVAVARAAKAAGVTRLGVVSALGADAASRVFYNRVKGEAEAALEALRFATLVIARPSFIAGDRASLGQADRPGEGLALSAMRALGRLVPASIRPIEDMAIASALIGAVDEGRPGLRVLSSAEMQRAG